MGVYKTYQHLTIANIWSIITVMAYCNGNKKINKKHCTLFTILMSEKFGTGTEDFFWRDDMPVSKDATTDLTEFRRISLENEARSEAVKIGYDCTEYFSESIVEKLFYIVFDQDGNPQEINEQEHTKLKENGIETYKIAQLSTANILAIVYSSFPGVIFVHPSFEINNDYWKDTLKHEKVHDSSPNLRYNECIDHSGFRESLWNYEKQNWGNKGKLVEEWFASSVQKEKYVPDRYKELVDLGNRIVGLLAELDGETIRKVFKDKKYSFSTDVLDEENKIVKGGYATRFVNKWQSQNKDERTATIMELIGRARNVGSDRMIFRDLVNAIDPQLFEMWFDGQLNNGDESRINQKIDKIENKS